MFKIVAERKVWWPVTLVTPLDDGKAETQSFAVQFRVRDVDGNLALAKEAVDIETNATERGVHLKLSDQQAEFIEQIVADWRDVASEDGSIPFTPENLRMAMKVQGAFRAILDAYRGCLSGENATRRGN